MTTSGCLTPPADAEDAGAVTFGMGLDITMEPGRPVFLEDAEDLSRFSSFLNSTGFLEPGACGYPEDQYFPLEGYNYTHYFGTLYAVVMQCVSHDRAFLTRESVRQLEEDGSVLDEFAKWRSRGGDSLEALEAHIERHANASNVLDIEFVAWAMERFRLHVELHDQTVPLLLEKYAEFNQSSIIYDAFLNQVRIVIETPLLIQWLNNYPWAAGACAPSPEEADALTKHTLAMAQEAIEAMEPLSSPGAEKDLGQTLGRLVQDYGPGARFHAERGWTPGLMWLLAQFEWVLARAEHTDATLPSRDEAIHLLKAYRSGGVSLAQDDVTQALWSTIFHHRAGYQEEQGRYVMTLDELGWHFPDYCT